MIRLGCAALQEDSSVSSSIDRSEWQQKRGASRDRRPVCERERARRKESTPGPTRRYRERPRGAGTKAHLILMDGERLLPEYQPLLSPNPTSECILLEA